jgi:Spy/CpxP family protein refolding chaperone
MRKIEAIVALGLIVASAMPALADDSVKGAAKTAAPAASQSASNSTDDSTGAPAAAGKGKHGKHEKGEGKRHTAGRGPGKRQVMALPDLTDKQKTQIQAIYDSKKDQFADLRKQMNALEADEWQQVQPILTPAQIDSLGGKKASASAATGAASSDADSAKTPVKGSASGK